MITEVDLSRQRHELLTLDREYAERYLTWRRERRTPGMFRSWWQFGLFCIFTGAMWGFVIWGGKILLLRGR